MGLTNPLHLAFIAMIALIFLGPKRLPDLAKTLGSGMREFRDAISTDHEPEVAEPATALEALAVAEQPVEPAAAMAPGATVSAAAPSPPAPPSPAEQELAGPIERART